MNTCLTARKLYAASWAVVAYTVLIILWGAWVRLSGSGDGCGDHWPLCNGEIVPLGHSAKTWIEYSHRFSTGVYGILIIMQIWLTRKHFAKGHPARFWAFMALIFTITEALLGRQLVKSGLVNESTDLSRLLVMPLHLLNTSFLIFSGVMTAESIRYGDIAPRLLSPNERRRGALYLVGLGLVLCSGAIAALGSHLLPSESLLHGLTHDLAPDSHPAVKLRILHPLLALTIPFGLILFAPLATTANQMSSQKLWYKRFALCTIVAVLIGIATLSLLAPLWLKLTHLLMTNLLVITLSLCIFHSVRPVAIPLKTNSDSL